MKTDNFYGLLLLLFLTVFVVGCTDDDESESLLFYQDYYEVPLHGTRYIGLKSGSSDYSLQVGNPGLFSASKEEGWSNPAGMLLVRGLLTGKSTLVVTDNRTGEKANLKVRVVDNYEVLRVSQLYRSDSIIKENNHPVLSKLPFVFLINNKSRDVYFADMDGEKSITENGIRIQGKGTYSLTKGDGKPCLTLIYATNNNGELTNDAAFVPALHKFQITESSEFLRHRLDENLNLGWETLSKVYPDNQRGLAMTMKETDSDYKLESKLEQVEIPTGVLN